MSPQTASPSRPRWSIGSAPGGVVPADDGDDYGVCGLGLTTDDPEADTDPVSSHDRDFARQVE